MEAAVHGVLPNLALQTTYTGTRKSHYVSLSETCVTGDRSVTCTPEYLDHYTKDIVAMAEHGSSLWHTSHVLPLGFPEL